MELTWNGRNWMEPGTGLNITRISYISINASVSTLNYVLSSDEQDPKYMHRCAGVCYSRGRGLYNRCNIELSQPLFLEHLVESKSKNNSVYMELVSIYLQKDEILKLRTFIDQNSNRIDHQVALEKVEAKIKVETDLGLGKNDILLILKGIALEIFEVGLKIKHLVCERFFTGKLANKTCCELVESSPMARKLTNESFYL